MRLFQASGQLSGPCGVGASAAGGVSRSAGGTFPPEEDPFGRLSAAPHPASVHTGGALFVLVDLFIFNILQIFSTLNPTPLCEHLVGNRGNGRVEAGPPETVPGLLCREASITATF